MGSRVRLSAHLATYTDARLVCGCGCGMGSRVEHWRPELLAVFEMMRGRMGRPLEVNSGWRCPSYNREVSIAELSQHAIGAALDIRVPPGVDYSVLAGLAHEAVRALTGAQGGVGLYPGYGMVHVDLGLGAAAHRRWSREEQ